jgi:hypothetical protein
MRDQAERRRLLAAARLARADYDEDVADIKRRILEEEYLAPARMAMNSLLYSRLKDAQQELANLRQRRAYVLFDGGGYPIAVLLGLEEEVERYTAVEKEKRRNPFIYWVPVDKFVALYDKWE